MTTIPKDILELLKPIRPLTKWLAKKHGGKWSYDLRIHTWICDDGKRIAQKRVSIHDEECAHPEIWIYEDGKTPERVCQ